MGQVYLGTACQTKTLSIYGNKLLHFIVNIYDGQFFHDREAACDYIWIAEANLCQHSLGNIYIETLTSIAPPIMRDLLMSGDTNISAWPSR